LKNQRKSFRNLHQEDHSKPRNPELMPKVRKGFLFLIINQEKIFKDPKLPKSPILKNQKS